jgi:hypothetical protein
VRSRLSAAPWSSPTPATERSAWSSGTAADAASAEWPTWKEHNASHHEVRARVDHVFARMKVLRGCRLEATGVQTPCSTSRLHNLTIAG